MDKNIYAINLYGSDIAFEGLILNVTTGEVLFYEGPARFGDLKVALVIPDKGVLFESSTWGAPSTRGYVSLSLFELTDSARRQAYEKLQSCLVKLPLNAYEWHYTLSKNGIVLHAKTAKGVGPLLVPAPD